jgi:Family of unknown function (DUF5682)
VTVHLLGVRHHGPGSARAVRTVLESARPEVVLIEGPPEADGLVALAAEARLRPPVALLAYPGGPKPDAEQKRAAFWPFAEFSPEWQAIRWAVEAGVPVRFCDLPAAIRFAAPDLDTGGVEPQHHDPIGELANIAGYDDPERWWEDVVEHQLADIDDPLAPFDAIAAAMGAVRAAAPPSALERPDEQRREAYMRQTLRAAMKRYAKVVVVCGAWHVPALSPPLPTATADARVLRGLPRTKVTMTWVPWTHGRLASWQGYGAGVSSPGWYHHLFTAPDRVIPRWFIAVAQVLRDERLPVSSAHVIEAVRLAETLAALRGRPLAGLSEVTEATRAVLCDGDDLRVALVNRKLVVGERLGEVPDDTPGVPLVRDLTAAQRRLRLRPSAQVKDLDLDLRRDIDADRSRLLHRLRLLDVGWGTPLPARRGKGTFWESWRLVWEPELAVDLIAASGYGTTVEAAASARSVERAGAASTVDGVTKVLERCLLAELPDALPTVLRALEDRMALDTDVTHLMDALPALARTLRYGDVRGTDIGSLRAVTATMLVRIRVGLPAAVTALDESAARQMRRRIDAVHAAVALLDSSGPSPGTTDTGTTDTGATDIDTDTATGTTTTGTGTGGWLDTLTRLAGRDDLAGLIAGRITRLLLDAGRIEADEARRRLGLVLTPGVPVARGAAWIEGFLSGGGLLLVHDERLLKVVDGWLIGIADESFIEVLPLLRRTFSAFPAPERRAIGERARALAHGRPVSGADEVDPRGDLVLPTVALLLGRDLAEVNP